MAQHLFFDKGRTAPLKALVREYLASGQTFDEEAVLGADFGSGVKVFRGSDGKLIADIPGQGQMRFDHAVAQGILRVSKKR